MRAAGLGGCQQLCFQAKLGWELDDWYENTLFVIFDPTWTQFFALKDPNMEFSLP